MCGRYAQAKDPATLAEEFDAIDATDGAWPGPDRNVAPTTTVIGVVDRHPRDDDGTPDPLRVQRSLRAMRWGLVPSWAKDPSVGNRMINARAESLADKPAFRRAAASRRCLLPADGWFEWRRGERSDGGRGRGERSDGGRGRGERSDGGRGRGERSDGGRGRGERSDGGRGRGDKAPGGTGQAGKTPFFMTLPSGASLALAGLWETWRPEKGADPLISATVVTTDAVGPLAGIHERMPLVLPAERWADWLDPDRADPTDLLAPPPTELLTAIEMRQVSTLVNNVRNHGPELVEESLGEPEQAGLDLDVDHPAGNPA